MGSLWCMISLCRQQSLIRLGDVQADHSRRWAHMSFCIMFCHFVGFAILRVCHFALVLSFCWFCHFVGFVMNVKYVWVFYVFMLFIAYS